MTTQTLARPAAAPAASLVLDRIFAPGAPARAANDMAAAATSLIVRRRERQHRRDAR
ncbi:MAG: hypothetical protein RLO80_08310 [Hyphomonas sp.]